MSYTPPGVQTFVAIAGNQVTLPGGTRILSLIGTANPTKFKSAESNIQTINLQVNTAFSGISSISRIYDYSGPGNSLYTYPSSGTGAFGSGYFVSGSANGTIAWTPAANAYPVSTTPASGVAFLVNYNYSGSTLSGTTLLESHVTSGVNYSTIVAVSGAIAVPLNISTILPSGSNGIVAVYSGSTTTSPTFAHATVDPSGAGWYQSGTTLYFTNGNYTTFSGASNAPAFKIPQSGATFYVNYGYSGSTVVSLTQNGVYTEFIPQLFPSGDTLVTSISAVSGTSGFVYPSSGTATNPDTSGYSTSGAGYSLSGANTLPTPSQFISWSAVNPATYTFPAATVVPVSGVFYTDYNYNKAGNDYTPLNFVAYNAVLAQEGNEADWTLLTSGPFAGTYQIARYNPLTIGAKVAFNNQASVLTLVQISGVGNTSGAFLANLAQLQGVPVDVIVPLTVGSGISTTEMPVSEKALALQYTMLHCETMSNVFNQLERVSLGSLGPAEIGTATTPNTYMGVAAQLADHRIALVAPGTAFIQLQDPSGQFQTIPVDGAYLAVAVGALSCSANNDPATPLTNQQLTGFTSISASTSGHPASNYLGVEMNNMAAGGVMIIAQNGSRIFVRHQLTTDQSNVINGEFSVVTLIDYVSQSIRFTTKGFIGKKLIPSLVIPAVQGTILATMQSLAAAGIISGIGTITVTIDPTDPTNLLSTVTYVPVFPLNRLKITFNIATSLS